MGRAGDYTPGGYVYGRIVAGATEGVRLGAQQVLTTSRQRVPIEEGTLERSCTVSAGSSTLPRVENGAIVAAVTYDTPYAARWHEELGYRRREGQ